MCKVKRVYEERFARPLKMPERLVKSKREELGVEKEDFSDVFRFSTFIDVNVNSIASPSP